STTWAAKAGAARSVSAANEALTRASSGQAAQRPAAVGRVAEGVLVDAEQVELRHQQVVVRLAPELEVAAGAQGAAQLAGQHEGNVVDGVARALAQLVAPDDQRVVEH